MQKRCVCAPKQTCRIDLIDGPGMDYKQGYAWIMRFDESGTIVQVRVPTYRRSLHLLLPSGPLLIVALQVRAYLDSAMVQKAVDTNTKTEAKY